MAHALNLLVAALALASVSSAYPAAVIEYARRHPSSLERAQAVMLDSAISDGFNASLQRIKTTGIHLFAAPGPNDLRGPCPGLNALANHAYIPHSGYTTVHELTEAVMKVYGMGSDLALFLSTYGAVIEGDLTTVSIGGQPSEVQAAPAAGQVLLGEGIAQSHNHFESDSSPINPDVDLPSSKVGAPATGSARLSQSRISNFEQLFAMQPNPATANYDLSALSSFRAQRFHHSVSHNPSFFISPFAGMIMAPKSYSFIYRLMANHSTEHPEGRMDQETLKSFFAMSGPDSNGRFVHQPGHERIPDFWFRRDLKNPYDNAFFLTDVLAQAHTNPEFLSVGGNIRGRTGAFREVDLNKLTSGTYGTTAAHDYDFAYADKLETIAQYLTNASFSCLGYQSALHGARSIIARRYADEFHATTTAIDTLRNALVPILDALHCPRLRKIDERLFEPFDGYRR